MFVSCLYSNLPHQACTEMTRNGGLNWELNQVTPIIYWLGCALEFVKDCNWTPCMLPAGRRSDNFKTVIFVKIRKWLQFWDFALLITGKGRESRGPEKRLGVKHFSLGFITFPRGSALCGVPGTSGPTAVSHLPQLPAVAGPWKVPVLSLESSLPTHSDTSGPGWSGIMPQGQRQRPGVKGKGRE